MTELGSELGAPLKRRGVRRQAAGVVARLPRSFPVARTAVALLALIAAVAVGRIAFVDDPNGGRPTQSVEIAKAPPSNAVAGDVAADLTTLEPQPAEDAATVDSGLPDVTDLSATDAAAAPLEPDLAEETEFGPIPRKSATGRTPFEAYSQPAGAAAGSGMPMVAIVVSGLGISPDGTANAIDKLPSDVTLAFAPYGKTLEASVEKARNAGHEVFLEVPLEPFDYPDNDPGPDTLLTGKPPRDNLTKLFSVMARFQGYAGLINNMGARFTSSGADFGPIMEELGARGLGYLDDGSSNRSLAPQLAEANRVPFGRVGVTLDAKPSRAAILEQLGALVEKARSDGKAIGIISALPVSIETVTDWAASLGNLGIEIVPASALMKG